LVFLGPRKLHRKGSRLVETDERDSVKLTQKVRQMLRSEVSFRQKLSSLHAQDPHPLLGTEHLSEAYIVGDNDDGSPFFLPEAPESLVGGDLVIRVEVIGRLIH
jgi:hypothetical protein